MVRARSRRKSQFCEEFVKGTGIFFIGPPGGVRQRSGRDPVPDARVRHKIQRWNTTGLERVGADRALRNLRVGATESLRSYFQRFGTNGPRRGDFSNEDQSVVAASSVVPAWLKILLSTICVARWCSLLGGQVAGFHSLATNHGLLY